MPAPLFVDKMNGVGTRKGSYNPTQDSKYGSGRPSDQVRSSPFPGYLKNGSTDRKQPNGTRYSAMLDPDDPASMHLLMEHALGDSQRYQVFSPAEIDELKRESSVLAARIEATRRKLSIETKVRDAAASISKLEPSRDASGKPHQRNMLSKSGGSETPNGNSEELTASIRKCEAISQELWRLEQRSQDVQRLLLEHTAGVLQMTHKGFLDKDNARSIATNGYSNGFDDLGLLDAGFDDRSFYQTLDSLLDSGATGPSAAVSAQQTQTMIETEQKIWDLNHRLRDAITQASVNRSVIAAPPDPVTSDSKGAGVGLADQIEYMEHGLENMRNRQSESARRTEERLESLNNHLRDIVIKGNQDPTSQIPLPPQTSGRGPDGQIAFLQGGLDALDQDMRKLRSSFQATHSRSRSQEERVGRYESTFHGLWQKITAEEEATRGLEDSSGPAPKEKFSIDSFASKVELLNTRATGLRQQKDILNRQIQQQREVNSKSDSQKDARLGQLTEEVDQLKKSLESANNETQSQMATTQSSHLQLTNELQQTREHQASLEELATAKSAETEKVKAEMEDLEGELVRLQTELTVSRAELDGAYGTRAQRAAEVAQHPALVAEIAELKNELASVRSTHNNANSSNNDLTQHVQVLQKELSETISEYEVMTKSSIEAEKERENLESTIDNLRDKCEALETELGDERVRWMGMKSPGVAGDRNSNEKGATSTSVLKNEFKKMMRETRAEHMKALRVSLLSLNCGFR